MNYLPFIFMPLLIRVVYAILHAHVKITHVALRIITIYHLDAADTLALLYLGIAWLSCVALGILWIYYVLKLIFRTE